MPVRRWLPTICALLLVVVVAVASVFAYIYRFSVDLPVACSTSKDAVIRVIDGYALPVADVAACIVPQQSGGGELVVLVTNVTSRILVFDDIRCAGNGRKTGIREPQYLAGQRDGGCELAAVGPYQRITLTAQIALHPALIPEVLLRERISHQSMLVTGIK